jgi:hypothetical protein
VTLTLETLSHGKIDAGYLSVYTGMVRLGEYAFATKYFCNFVQHLAEHPDEREGAILAYGLDKFQQEFGTNNIESVRVAMESLNYPSELIRKTHEQFPKEGEADLQHELKMLAVRISGDSSSITIGQYEIPAADFGVMAYYVANGGWLGWRDEEPEFAEPTLSKMKKSKNKLFEEYQNWLNK